MAQKLTNLVVRQDGKRKTKVIAQDYIVSVTASPVMGCVMFRVNNGVNVWIPIDMLTEAMEKYTKLATI